MKAQTDTKPPRILAIAGSDSSGGAGIQADIKTITQHGGYAMTAITAITAQNSCGVTAVELVKPEMVLAQIDACLSDIGADAIKIGMIGGAELAASLAAHLASFRGPIVFDPVMVATSGARLADEATIRAFGALMERAALVTPNLPELEVLTGARIANRAGQVEGAQIDSGQIEAAQRLAAQTGTNILAKGGHDAPDAYAEAVRDNAPHIACTAGNAANASGHLDQAKPRAPSELHDFLVRPDGNYVSYHHDLQATRHTHGTGCTLSSAIAALLGRGLAMEDACAQGIAYVQSAIAAAPGFGQGSGPLGHHSCRGL